MFGLEISGVFRIQDWLSTESLWSVRVHGFNILNITVRTNSTAILGFRISIAVFIADESSVSENLQKYFWLWDHEIPEWLWNWYRL